MQIRLVSKEQEELVLKNQKLVRYLVSKLSVSSNDYEDFVSIGTIGLIKAAATFDKSKNIKFATYATQCINNEIFMHFRKEKSHINDISLYEPIVSNNDGTELTLFDTIASYDKDFTEVLEENDVFAHFISIILNLLKSKERLIMLYQIAGYNQRFIAEIFNVTQSYISRLEKQLNEKVKSYLQTKKQYKEVFSMAIVGDFYQISFSSKDIKNFNKIFATLLRNLASTEELPDFDVNCDNKRILIKIPAHLESFSFVAQIIQEIDNYSLNFVSDKTRLTANNMNLQDGEKDDSIQSNSITEESTINETAEDAIVENSSKPQKTSQVKLVRDYILSLDSFTVKELKQHFPDLASATISNALHLAKTKGLITPIDIGQYKVIKN